MCLFLTSCGVRTMFSSVSGNEFAKQLYKAVGEKIATERRSEGRALTQGALAERTGNRMSRSAIANIERGRQRLALHHLYMIAEALDVEPRDLLPPATSASDRAAATVSDDPELRAWLSRVLPKRVSRKLEEASDAEAKPD